MNDLSPSGENKISEEIILENDPASANKAQITNTIKYIIDYGVYWHVVSITENLYNFTPGNFGDITIATGKKLC